MKKHLSHNLLSSISLGAILLTSGAVQTSYAADEGNAVLEEITVTARRRSESLQSVPVAVTAFSAENLAKFGATDITFLAQSTPNTTLKVSRGTSSTITAFIRGIGQQDPVAGFESGVGIYLDGVYLNRPQGAVLEIYDVERIEILRGPQGTLYGRNTIGGAIKYVTKRIGDEPEMRIKASGGTHGQMDILASASAPVTDALALGGSIAYFSRDGFGKNLNTGENHYDKDLFAIRLSAELTPSENVFIKLSGDYTKDTSNAKGGHRLTVSSVAHGSAPILDNVFDTRSGLAGKQEVIQKGIHAYAEWDVSETVTLKSTTAYREDETVSPIDFDSLPLNFMDVPVIYTNDQLSQEFQLVYEAEKVQGVMGFFYLDANAFNEFDVILSDFGITSYTFGDVNTKTWAISGDVNYDMSETVSVSVGGRYTSDKRTSEVKKQTFLGLGSLPFGNESSILIATKANFIASKTFNKFTPKVSLKWQPNDDVNVYASFSQGFKGGGFDPRGDDRAIVGFESETVNTYEIGLKSTLVDGRVSTNIATFFSDFKNIQIPGSVIVDGDFIGTTTNAGKAEIWGVEFEGKALLSDNLTANANVGYINADYKEFIVGGVNVADDRNFQNTPEWSLNASLNYEQPLNLFGDDGDINLIGSVSYKSKTYNFEVETPLLDQDGYAILDLSLVWTAEDGSIQVGIHGKNLTDKEYKVAGYNFPSLDTVTAFFGNPRTVTATVDFRF
ncbi:MAG: TonB-dependent receptor [Alphaproteobacteria bacterium]|nr:MAG: TonB-dependent receptor [Alphaproteobacteria bacterium]